VENTKLEAEVTKASSNDVADAGGNTEAFMVVVIIIIIIIGFYTAWGDNFS
jgi:hypothetical protein